MEQYKIEIAVGDQGKFFDITPLGHARYQIAVEGEPIGTIQLDEKDYARCESQGCELDMPELQAIREGIQYHEQWTKHENNS
jgi:hypothetical protein